MKCTKSGECDELECKHIHEHNYRGSCDGGCHGGSLSTCVPLIKEEEKDEDKPSKSNLSISCPKCKTETKCYLSDSRGGGDQFHYKCEKCGCKFSIYTEQKYQWS